MPVIVNEFESLPEPRPAGSASSPASAPPPAAPPPAPRPAERSAAERAARWRESRAARVRAC